MTIPDIAYTLEYGEQATSFDVSGEMFNSLEKLTVEEFQEVFEKEKLAHQ